MLLLLVAGIQYSLLTPLNIPAEKFISVHLDLDTKIKLIPAFLFPYFSVYILLLLIFILIIRKRDTADMTIFLMSIVCLWSLINVIHGYLPTENIIRPELTETGFFFEKVNDLYLAVKPFRTLPSWHAATAVLCAIAFTKMKFRGYIYVIVWAVLIFASPIFLKMNYIADIGAAIPLAFLCYMAVEKISAIPTKRETVQEVVKAFTMESLVQSVAIGIRDESTLTSLIEGLTRIEKNLTDKDKEEIKNVGSHLDPPADNLKEIINNMISSLDVERHLERARLKFAKGEKAYRPSDKDMKQSIEELIFEACRPFDDSKFRYLILEIKKRNTQLMNTSSIEEAAKERSQDIIYRFKIFIESNKKDMAVLRSIMNNTNGHLKLNFDEVRALSRELRKPPYEISPDEIWNAYYRTESARVKPIGELKNPANIISLTQFAMGKIDFLEPFRDKVDRKFNDWIDSNVSNGRIFTEDELEWLKMMKTYISSFLEINMTSFNQPPFVNKGGASRAYNIFGHDLNRILYELNEKLI